MANYRVPVFYDPSHYKDRYAEGKDVGTWMINTLGSVLTENGFQSENPGHFQDITDRQKDGSDVIFAGQITGADGSAAHTVSIRGTEPRELIVSLDGQAVGNATDDAIFESFLKLLEKAYFTRSRNPFVKEESVTKSEPAAEVKTNEEAKTGGCYIATAVYGSYDCPEVWTLRRYRDRKLMQSMSGRMFVKLYYATSPAVVKLFGETGWFNRFWRAKLNRMVDRLHADGYEDTPYTDR